MTDAPEMYLIEKRGLYYRPEACGYTGIRDEAGTWSFDDAVCMFPNIASANQDGVTIISLSDAPEFSGSCCEGIKLRYVLGQRDAQAARIAELEAALREALIEVDKLGNHCVGCGHMCGDPEKDLAMIRKAGGISCCPERKMEPISATLAAMVPTLTDLKGTINDT